MAVDASSVSAVLGGEGFTLLSQFSGTITSAQMVDPYVPVDGTMNVTGAVVLADGSGIDADFIQMATAAGAFEVRNSAGTFLARFGNTGTLTVNGPIVTSANSVTATGFYLTDTNVGLIETVANSLDVVLDGSPMFRFDQVSAGNNQISPVATNTSLALASTGDGNIDFYQGSNNVADITANGIRVNSGFGLAVGGVTAIKTTDYVATASDFFIPVDVATTGDVAVTLPAANAAKGQILMIKATSLHVTRDININRAGADTITTSTAAGATTLQLSPTATYNCAVLVSDGTATWYVVNLM